MNFADTNFLVALYSGRPSDRKQDSRRHTAAHFMRKHGGRLLLSHIVLVEARNIFSRLTGEANPAEWEELVGDFDGKLFVDPMNWHLLRREADQLFAQYAPKQSIGTLDALIVASAKLAGTTRFLSFDPLAAALAAAEDLGVFPELDGEGKRLLKSLASK
jgi:predicted nucleic acid-binding protein